MRKIFEKYTFYMFMARGRVTPPLTGGVKVHNLRIFVLYMCCMYVKKHTTLHTRTSIPITYPYATHDKRQGNRPALVSHLFCFVLSFLQLLCV